MDKPTVLPVLIANVPAELRAMPRWVMWRYTLRRGTWAKVPYQVNGRAAKSTDASTWTSFDDASDALIMGGPDGRAFDGIGIVLGDGLHGVDLDDCRDPVTGALNERAQQVLERLQGIAEVSPSGTGIKILTRSNLDRARVKHELGIECYADGRYFTITGQRVNGHDCLPLQLQDLGWLVRDIMGDTAGLPAVGQGVGGPAGQGAGDDDALANYRAPLEGWDLERVTDEVLTHLDPDCGYAEWLNVGMVLHHQGQGDESWLQAWDEWSAGSDKYVEGDCAAKWASFKTLRTRGEPKTLASLLKATREQREHARAADARGLLDELLQAVEDCTDERHLQERIAARAANSSALIDVERGKLAGAILAKAKALGSRVTLTDVRGWVRSRVSVSSVFVHLNDDGNPLCTLENMRVLVRQLGYTVRYNVIKKGIEILIPGARFTRDNRDNAALACVLSECEKARMPTKHVAQFLIKLADENPYNPVATWIDSRPWDGTSRVDAFCATVRSAGHEDLKNRLLRKWMIQAVAAALSPDGIANQGVLTFVGPQNIGKTTWFQRLAPPELDAVLTGHTLDTKSKDSIFVALSFWLVELGEVDATIRKSDISALKSFITQPHDKLRRPYAATESSFGRRTTFGATVNDDQFLHDPTGNRRFWTIEVEGFEIDHGIDMQQLWAEVRTLWEAGEPWFLDQVEVAELNEHNEKFVVTDPIEERIAEAYPWSGATVWRELTAGQVLVELGMREPNKYQAAVAGRALAKLNNGRRRKTNGRWLFAVPQEDFLG